MHLGVRVLIVPSDSGMASGMTAADLREVERVCDLLWDVRDTSRVSFDICGEFGKVRAKLTGARQDAEIREKQESYGYVLGACEEGGVYTRFLVARSSPYGDGEFFLCDDGGWVEEKNRASFFLSRVEAEEHCTRYNTERGL